MLVNYALHYDRLIARARDRTLNCYKERHHVIPHCLGGDDSPSNQVDLTGEEHYVAHQLLVQLHHGNASVAHAAVLMSTRCSNNKAYGWLKRRMAAAMRGNKRSLGTKRTPEVRAIMSERQRGNKKALGKKLPPFTPEHREKLSAAKLGRKLPAEHAAAIARGNKGKKHSQPMSAEHRAKIGMAKRGVKPSPETTAKRSASMKIAWIARRAKRSDKLTLSLF